MIEIILLILKIIGITALSLLGFVLLLIILVLFVPIRYKIESTNEVDGQIEARGVVSFLLHMIHIRIDYKKNLIYYVKIFGVKIYPRKERNRKKSKTDQNEKIVSKEESDLKIKKRDLIEESKIVATSEEKYANNTVKKEKSKKEKREANKKKNKFTFSGLYDKIKETYFSIKKNIDLLTEESTKRAIALCKKELLHILKAIFPRKIKGIVRLGLDNPALTGEIYGGYCALFPIHKGNIVLIPYFEEKNFEYRVKALGRVRIITLIIIAVKVYFNKDIQRLIKIFKKEEE